ncbi:hypothetical protein HX780_06575 [Pseudomonas tolaasii]|uniref:hypothetical protein n=1 Tax=Pseudomonas tolaasii TaxID=29442 RepID=UPI0015A497A5|nr:hypothetical protein [Pseudomonas tolaasii]NVZ45097.1 hypothetical protein [Pseudomonas tolaasii]NWA47958.1 hypothetical protein [Pseudomonas tolaasii]
MSWEVVSCWIESHPGLASWVQAIGSIAAILIAVTIAHRDSVLRRREKSESRNAALVRAFTVVDDAAGRVREAFDAAKKFGINPKLLSALTSDLDQSRHYLNDAISIEGLDSDLYTQLFMARKAVEDVIYLLPGIGSVETESVEAELKNSIMCVAEALTSMRKTG